MTSTETKMISSEPTRLKARILSSISTQTIFSPVCLNKWLAVKVVEGFHQNLQLSSGIKGRGGEDDKTPVAARKLTYSMIYLVADLVDQELGCLLARWDLAVEYISPTLAAEVVEDKDRVVATRCTKIMGMSELEIRL